MIESNWLKSASEGGDRAARRRHRMSHGLFGRSKSDHSPTRLRGAAILTASSCIVVSEIPSDNCRLCLVVFTRAMTKKGKRTGFEENSALGSSRCGVRGRVSALNIHIAYRVKRSCRTLHSMKGRAVRAICVHSSYSKQITRVHLGKFGSYNVKES